MRASLCKRFTILVVFVIAALIPQMAWADDLTVGTTEGNATVSYRVHQAGGSWSGWKSADAQAGSAQDAGRIDGISIAVGGTLAGGIQYQAYVKKQGWQGVKSNAACAGKLSSKYDIEAVRIALTGDASKYYDVLYSVKRQGNAWSAYASNGGVAGAAYAIATDD